MERVAITGMGLVSAIGHTVPETWANIVAGRSGIGYLSRFDGAPLGVYLAAEVSDFDPDAFLRVPRLKRYVTRPAGFLLSAVGQALSEAGMLTARDRGGRDGMLIVGAGSQLGENYWGVSDEARRPTWYLETFPNVLTALLSVNFELTCNYNTIINACASGTKAIIEASRMIKHGYCDYAIAGAVDSKVSLEHMTGFKRLGVLSGKTEKTGAMRPFDAARNGTVIGEGAGALVLERAGHAVARGAPIYGYVAGGGEAMDAHSLVEPPACGRGVIAAMQRAILASQIDVRDIGHINAHGTATRANDAAESRAIASLLGPHADNVPITSSKPYFGHTTAASGVLEAIVTLLSMKAQVVHPMPHAQAGAGVCQLDYLTEEPRAHSFEYALSNSAGLGGFNASVILTSRQSAH